MLKKNYKSKSGNLLSDIPPVYRKNTIYTNVLTHVNEI